MATLEVFAETWCSVASLVHDNEPEACRLAADIEWLAAHGVPVVRTTLSEDPGRFVEHDAVRFLMNVLGPDVLPVILVDGVMRSHGVFPPREQLAQWAGVEPELENEVAEHPLTADGGHHRSSAARERDLVDVDLTTLLALGPAETVAQEPPAGDRELPARDGAGAVAYPDLVSGR